MSNERFNDNVGKFGYFVNAMAVAITITLIAAGYFQAVGAFAGIA